MKKMPALLAMVTTAVAGTSVSLMLVSQAAPPASGPADPVIVAAGDIACPNEPCPDNWATADLITQLDPTAVLALGDTQYPAGDIVDFRNSYDLTWGRFLGRTYPVPGNHEYQSSPSADGYFEYFGERAFGPKGWYSFNLGEWHLIALNSRKGREPPSDAQLAWLETDLAADDSRCQLAFWHHPRWSSGVEHGSNANMGAFWRVLHADRVDVVLNGHEHNYERFKPMLPNGTYTQGGIRQFVVGTGGIGDDYGFQDPPLENSYRRLNAIGLLELELHPGSYEWRFMQADGFTRDPGHSWCHGPEPVPTTEP